MNDEETGCTDGTVTPVPQTRRRLVCAGLMFAAVIGLYVLWRVVFGLWNSGLPADAPRIAFSLDNTWLGQIGITDANYQQAMTRAGGRLVTIRPDAAGAPDTWPEAIETLLDEQGIDGIMLTGGGDIDPALYGDDPDDSMLVNRVRDEFELALIRIARERNIPVLGLCRGCQILNVACGGTLRNLRDDENLKDAHFTFAGHPIELVPGSRLADLLGVTRLDDVYSFHGQAVGRLGTDVTAVATGPGGVVEAVEVDADNEQSWIVAVQWHPEMAVTDKIQNKLFTAFVDRARTTRRR